MIVKLASVTGGSSVGDVCSVEVANKVYPDAVILAVGEYKDGMTRCGKIYVYLHA